MKRDKAYLKHILDAISNTEKFVEGVNKENFLGNVEKQYAVLRGLEIIGEATKNLSEELKRKHPNIPWKEIAGIRDKRCGTLLMKEMEKFCKKQSFQLL